MSKYQQGCGKFTTVMENLVEELLSDDNILLLKRHLLSAIRKVKRKDERERNTNKKEKEEKKTTGKVINLHIKEDKERRKKNNEEKVILDPSQQFEAVFITTKKKAGVRTVLKAWNSCAARHGWQQSMGMEQDRKKVKAALNRSEFARGWKEMLDIIDTKGLPFVGRGKFGDWMPKLEWFCRASTSRKIMEGEYWRRERNEVMTDDNPFNK